MFSIDKNYAAVLIIWDRMFGTFSEERIDEPVVYGLITPIKTYNPITIQCKYFYNIFKYWTKNVSLKFKIQKTLKGPGWNLKKQEHYPLPKIDKKHQPWNVENDSFFNSYVIFQVKFKFLVVS
jgi:alkylglycerol monooxygenase